MQKAHAGTLVGKGVQMLTQAIASRSSREVETAAQQFQQALAGAPDELQAHLGLAAVAMRKRALLVAYE